MDGCVKDVEGGDGGAGADPPQRGGTDTPKQPDGGCGMGNNAVANTPPARPNAPFYLTNAKEIWGYRKILWRIEGALYLYRAEYKILAYGE